jgi:type I restriction enzyme S subunit
MIPKGWEYRALEELASIKRGKFSPRPRNDPRYYGGSTPFVQTGDVVAAKKYLTRYSQTLNDDGVGVSKVFPSDTILITIAANIGATAITTFPVACPDSVVGINPFPKIADCEWLKAVLERKQPELDSQATQNAQKNINLEVLKPLQILAPPFPEQQLIGLASRTWDHAIETVEALIANVRAQKQALMQQLLPRGTTPPKRRLPGFSGEWREIRLGAAFSERVERGDDQLPLLSVTQASGVIPQGEAGRRNISSEDQSNYKTVRAGDIAYNTMRMWQGASALSTLTGKVSPAYTIVTPRKGHDAVFYAYLFKQPKMIHVFERHSQGLVSDTWNLKYPHLAKIRTCVPDIEEQRAIAAAFRSLDDSTRAYETQLAALRQEKAALMQQLLTGKRRVKLPESEVA